LAAARPRSAVRAPLAPFPGGMEPVPVYLNQ